MESRGPPPYASHLARPGDGNNLAALLALLRAELQELATLREEWGVDRMGPSGRRVDVDDNDEGGGGAPHPDPPPEHVYAAVQDLVRSPFFSLLLPIAGDGNGGGPRAAHLDALLLGIFSMVEGASRDTAAAAARAVAEGLAVRSAEAPAAVPVDDVARLIDEASRGLAAAARARDMALHARLSGIEDGVADLAESFAAEQRRRNRRSRRGGGIGDDNGGGGGGDGDGDDRVGEGSAPPPPPPADVLGPTHLADLSASLTEAVAGAVASVRGAIEAAGAESRADAAAIHDHVVHQGHVSAARYQALHALHEGTADAVASSIHSKVDEAAASLGASVTSGFAALSAHVRALDTEALAAKHAAKDVRDGLTSLRREVEGVRRELGEVRALLVVLAAQGKGQGQGQGQGQGRGQGQASGAPADDDDPALHPAAQLLAGGAGAAAAAAAAAAAVASSPAAEALDRRAEEEEVARRPPPMTTTTTRAGRGGGAVVALPPRPPPSSVVTRRGSQEGVVLRNLGGGGGAGEGGR
jgi:BMFP domain-containing protein YqiC